jgi:hypothetical protein
MALLGTGRISPEQYKIAKANGIDRNTLHTRVYVNDWELGRAITQPVKRQQDLWKQWGPVSKVAYSTFYMRMKKGMTPEEAATLPPGKPKKPPGRITPEDIKRAEANGICKATLHSRVFIYNWPIEKAITRPLKPNGRRGKWNEAISARSVR